MQSIKSKKRKNNELAKPMISLDNEEIQQEFKKVKQNNTESSNNKEVSKAMCNNNDILSLECLLKESEDIYENMIKKLQEREEEQNIILEQIQEDFNAQKQEDVALLKCMKRVIDVSKGDETIEKVVEDLENECQDLRKKVECQEKLNKELERIQKKNDELKELLDRDSKNEKENSNEVYYKIEKVESELKAKNRKIKELQSVVELYYSLTNLKVNVDYGSQDPISEFYCNIRSETKANELEFKLKDTEENEIEYNPIKCQVTKDELESYPFLQEEISFDLMNLKKFFKTVFEVVNKD